MTRDPGRVPTPPRWYAPGRAGRLPTRIRVGRLVSAGAVILSSLALSGREAHAARLTVTLEYTTEAGCPDAVDFEAIVVARLGYDPFVEAAPDHVLVRIEPRGGAVTGRIEWRNAAGAWTGDQAFRPVSTDCSRLVRAMGFALAVQIQLLATANAPASEKSIDVPAGTGPPPEAPAAGGTVKAPAAAIPSPEPVTVQKAAIIAPSPGRGPGPTFAAGAGPSVGFGVSSAPVLFGRLFGAVAWPHVSFELAAMASVPTTTRREDGAGFSQQHLLGSAAACGTVTRWNACLLAGAGEVRMAGNQIDRPTSASVPLVEVGVRAGAVQPLGRRAFLSAHADGMVNVVRWSASLDNVTVWTAPRFAAALGIDAGLRLP